MVFLTELAAGAGLDLATLPADKQADLLENDDVLALAAANTARTSLQDMLPTMRMPCFLYGGDRDGALANIERCAKEIPHATFMALPNLDHPEGFYRSDIVLPVVSKFLRATS